MVVLGGGGAVTCHSACIAPLEATQGQHGSFLSQLPYKCSLEEEATVGDWLKICPWVASCVGEGSLVCHLRAISRLANSELVRGGVEVYQTEKHYREYGVRRS